MRIVLVLAALTCSAAEIGPARDAWNVLDLSLRSDTEHKCLALAALATVHGPEAVQRAVAALDDKDALVRQAAALALGQMKAADAAPALERALDDTGEVAFAAAKALTDIGTPDVSRAMLIAVLAGERKDTPGIMTNAMRRAKHKLKHPQGLVLMGAQDAAGAMIGPAAWGITVAKDAADLRGKGAPGRAAAAAYLAKDPDPDALALLEWALSDDNQFVRAEAAKGLGARGSRDTILRLQPLLSDDHTRVRTLAAASIINLSAK